MTDELDRTIFFDSIFLVLWAVVFVPCTLGEGKYVLLLLTFFSLVLFEIYLTRNLREYPYNIVAGIIAASLGLGGVFSCTTLMNGKRRNNHERA